MAFIPASSSVVSFQSDPTKLLTHASVSGVVTLGPTSISGVGLFNVNHVGSGSVLTVSLGSIATAPSPASVSGVGLFNVNHIGNGSIITVFSSPSIVGTYAEDGVHTSADRGLFVLGVRNDTVASFVSANLDYAPEASDSAGRRLTKPFAPVESSIFSHASVVNGGDSGSVLVMALAGTGLRNYITDWTVSNTGSVATLITFTEGGGSVLGRTIAPAGGGSNGIGMNFPISNVVANQPINMVTTTASSVVYVAMWGHRAP